MSFFLNVNFCKKKKQKKTKKKKKLFLGVAYMTKKRLCVFWEKKGDFSARLNSARLCSARPLAVIFNVAFLLPLYQEKVLKWISDRKFSITRDVYENRG